MQNLAGLARIDGLGHIDIAGIGTLISDGVGHIEYHTVALRLAAGQVDNGLTELHLDILDIEVSPGATGLQTADGNVAGSGIVDVCERNIVFVVGSRVESDGLHSGEGRGVSAVGKVANLEAALGGAAVVGSLKAHLDGVESEAHLGQNNHTLGAVDIYSVVSCIDCCSTARLCPAVRQAGYREGLYQRHIGILPSRAGGTETLNSAPVAPVLVRAERTDIDHIGGRVFQAADNIVSVLVGGVVLAVDIGVESRLGFTHDNLPLGGGHRHRVLCPAQRHAVGRSNRCIEGGNHTGGGGGEVGHTAPVGGIASVVGTGHADAAHLPLIARLGKQVGECQAGSACSLSADALVVEVGAGGSIAHLPLGGSGETVLRPAQVGCTGIDILRSQASGGSTGRYRHNLDIVDIDVVGTCGRSPEGYACTGRSLCVVEVSGEGLPVIVGAGNVCGLNLLNRDKGRNVSRVSHITDLQLTISGSTTGSHNLERHLQRVHRVAELRQYGIAVVACRAIHIEIVVVGRSDGVGVCVTVRSRVGRIRISSTAVGTFGPARANLIRRAATRGILETIDIVVVLGNSDWGALGGERIDLAPVADAVGAAVGADIEVVGRLLIKVGGIEYVVSKCSDSSQCSVQRAGTEHHIPAAFSGIGAVLCPVDGGSMVGQRRGVDIARLDARRQQADLDVVNISSSSVGSTVGRSQDSQAASSTCEAIQRNLEGRPRIRRSNIFGLHLLNQLEGADIVRVSHHTDLNSAIVGT